MVRQALTLVILALSSLAARAYVTVYSARLDCDAWLMHRSVQGLRRSLQSDPTEQPPTVLPMEAYRYEVLSGVEKVRSIYQEIFHNRNMGVDEANTILKNFASEDEARVQQSPDHNGLDNTVYFVRRGTDDTVISVVRATVLRQGDRRKLPVQRYMDLPDGNRVELERAYNAPGPWAHISASELMMVVAQFLHERFKADDYTIYLLTDAARARHYRSTYGFEAIAQPQLPAHLGYLCRQTGAHFYDRYAGHVQRAYSKAFYTYPYGSGKEPALKILTDYLEQPGMKDYIPNLAAQAGIHAAFREYDKAVAISNQLRTIGHAEVNTDFLALWTTRQVYDPFANQGTPEIALIQLIAYLHHNPLRFDVYNDRAALFLLYELKILLGQEDFVAAHELFVKYRLLFQAAQTRMANLYQRIWTGIQAEADVGNRRDYLLYALDLSTHIDPLATSALYAQTWHALAETCVALGQTERARHYRAIADAMAEW